MVLGGAFWLARRRIAPKIVGPRSLSLNSIGYRSPPMCLSMFLETSKTPFIWGLDRYGSLRREGT